MKKLTIIMALLVIIVAIAGCTKQQVVSIAMSETSATAASTTSAPSTTAAPAVQETIVPDNIVDANPDPGALNDVSVDTRVLG
jgi:hypothetical protein